MLLCRALDEKINTALYCVSVLQIGNISQKSIPCAAVATGESKMFLNFATANPEERSLFLTKLSLSPCSDDSAL